MLPRSLFMSLYHKVVKVKALLKDADNAASRFSKYTGTECIQDCMRCCIKSDLMATPLEFLPAAWDLYKKGKAEKYYDYLSDDITFKNCIFLSPFKNEEGKILGCSNYENRGLICRLFGFSHNNDKNGKPRVVSCSTLKQTHQTEISKYLNSEKTVKPKESLSDFYFRLTEVDQKLAFEMMPVNKAIQKALEIVLFYKSMSRKHA